MRISYQSKTYSTHNLILIKTLLLSEGPVLELGSGFFSTPLLHWMCKGMGRKLVTYESNPDYLKFAKKFQSQGHTIRFITNWDEVDFKTYWGVVFIDHTTERRSVDAINFKDSADYIIIHDTNTPDEYGYDKVWPHFKYRYDWKDCRPWTTVVSNFMDVSKWDGSIPKIV
ncbi:MAG: hypothetical protein NTX96_02270 [Candidatus Zambryskibacteria bacterium]|nr:hypothetical protein [Candidatus Zambryskibacteria bacterium]